MTAITSSGSIELDRIGGRATARATSGWVKVNDVGGDVIAESYSDSVTVTNVKMGAQRVVTTDSVGAYQIPNLDAGDYKVEVTLTGFADITRQITLSARQIARLDVDDPIDCLVVFKSNRDAGLILFAGLVLDAALRA